MPVQINVAVYIASQWDDVEKELNRLKDLPGREGSAVLDSVLASAFSDAQEKVHILSGSLKASGRSYSTDDGDVWTGTMHWGDTDAPPRKGTRQRNALTPNNRSAEQKDRDRQRSRDYARRRGLHSVDYALFEYSRGSTHNWLRDSPQYEEEFLEAMLSILRGD